VPPSLLIGYHTNNHNEPVTIDLRGLLHHTLIVGQSGSGKSFFVARLVEEILTRTRARVVVLDPNGDFSASSNVSDVIWNSHGDVFNKLAGLSSTLTLSPLEERDAFAQAWSRPRFVYLQGDHRSTPQNLLSQSRVVKVRLYLHWDDLGDERHFLLQADARVHPKVALGLAACQERLEDLRRNQTEGSIYPDLGGLIQVAEAFANRDVALGEYDYVRSFDVDDWSAVRARLVDLQTAYKIWWPNIGRSQVNRPDGLCEFLDRPFDRGPSDAGHWDLLTLGLDSTPKADQLLSADVALSRLWLNAQRAWRSRSRPSEQGGETARSVPTFIVVDEAHNFAPAAEVDDPLRRRVADRLLQIASEGRKYGLYLILATQRPTKLHKELVPECENCCVMRIQSALEQNFASEVLGLPQTEASTAAKFTQGQGLLFGRWVKGNAAINATSAPARIQVGGGGLDDWWTQTPESVEVVDESDGLSIKLRDTVGAELRASSVPVTLVELANRVMAAFPGTVGPEGDWLETGSFKNLLKAIEIDDLRFLTTPPGFAYLQDRHDPKVVEHKEHGGLRRDVHDETGVPLLSDTQFAEIFRVLAEIVNAEGYNLGSLTANARDRLKDSAEPVPRGPINFVVKGISASGHSWRTGAAQDAGTLARAFFQNVERLVAVSGLDLNSEQKLELEAWIVGNTLLGEATQSGDVEALNSIPRAS
jgi:Helicase HerA, central domain